MPGKTSKQYFFEVQLNWLADTRGILTAKDSTGSIHVATPPEFGGSGKPWTAEHLFISSICSSFMSTYLLFTKKLSFEISSLRCEAIGQVEIIDGKYKFTTINLYPKIFITDELLRDKANLAAEKTHKHCLITNSINPVVFYHTEIQVTPENEVIKNDLYEHSN